MFKKKSEAGGGSSAKGLWDSYYKALLKPDFPKAISILNSLRESEPENPQLFIKLGDCQQRAANTPQAIESYHKAASLFVSGGFTQKAVAIYKIILRLDPANKEAIKKTRDVIEGIERERSQVQQYGGPLMPSESGELIRPPVSGGSAAPSEETAPPEETSPPPTQSWPSEETIPPPSQSWPSEETIPPPAWPQPEEGEAAGSQPDMEEQAGEPDEEPHPAEEAPQGEEPWPSLDISEIAPPPEAPETEEPETEAPETEARAPDIPDILSGLNREIADYLLGNTMTMSFKNGEAVIREGDTGDSLYIIRKGRADVVLQLLGRTLKLAVLSEGDVFGEVAFLTGRPRTASVIAVGELTVLELTGDVLRAAIEQDPGIMQKLMGFYQSRVQDTIRKVKRE